ncbi:MAG: DNA-directed RNA polymerase subunit beta, partial [candidate division NC10 bacterium]|nr:DNA-directed RNA polymerase subunit beta [candidate division NC10 bacterium]
MAVVKAKGAGDRISFAKIPEIIAIPNLIEIQRRSFDQFLQHRVPPDRREQIGLQGVFSSIFPVNDYDDSASLEFVKYEFGQTKYSPVECREKGMTYSAPLKVTLRLVVWDKGGAGEAKSIRDIKEQEVYLGEMPLMTEHGTFVINGTERVVVSQLHRSPGVFFDHDGGKTHPSGKILYSARLIPYRGSWLEFEFDASDILHVRIDRRRKFVATILLRGIGYGSNEEILRLFYERDVVQIERGKEFALVLLDRVDGKEIQLSPGVGWRVAKDVVDPRSKEVILPRTKKLSRASVKKAVGARIRQVPLYKEDLLGRITAVDVVDGKTGEVLLECAQELTAEALERILERGVERLQLLQAGEGREQLEIRDTLLRDASRSEEEALVEIYRRMRPGDPPTVESA